MAGDMNRATLIGRVGKDPAIKTMNSGDKVANFSLATSESWTKNGEKQEKTTWHDCVVWGKLAEIVERYVKKGSKILIEGAIEKREYEKDGQKRYAVEVVLRGFNSQLILLGEKSERAESSSSSYATASGGTANDGYRTPVDEDPIPFITSAGIL